MEIIAPINYVMLRGDRFVGVVGIRIWALRERFRDKRENSDIVTSSLLVNPPSSFGSFRLQSLRLRRCLIGAGISCAARGRIAAADTRSRIARRSCIGDNWFSWYSSASNCGNFEYRAGSRYVLSVRILASLRPFPMRGDAIAFQDPHERARTGRWVCRLDKGPCLETKLS